jgi:hypothetical protein
MIDLNPQIDETRVPSFPALCCQLAKCLAWYSGYLVDANTDGRFNDVMAQIQQLREHVEGWHFEGDPDFPGPLTRPTTERTVPWTGLVVHESDLPPKRPPWAK